MDDGQSGQDPADERADRQAVLDLTGAIWSGAAVQADVLLPDEALPRLGDKDRAGVAGDLRSSIRGAGIHHHDLRSQVAEALQTTRKVGFLVEGETRY